jgi:predicted sulfurtransferase
MELPAGEQILVSQEGLNSTQSVYYEYKRSVLQWFNSA